MPIAIRIAPSAASVAELRAQLSDRQVKQALFQIVKRTATRIRMQIVDRVIQQLDMVPKYAKRSVVSRVHAGTDIPGATVTMSYEELPLTAYRPSVSRRAGVSVLLDKERGIETFRHAFKATLRSGRVGIFERARPFNPKPGQVTPRGISRRLPIKQLYGPPAIDVFDDPLSQAEIERDAEAYIREQVRSQIRRFIGRAA